MIFIKNSNDNLYFPKRSVNLWLWLLLVGISVKSFGQVYLGENTKISIQKGTVFHISENTTDVTQKARIYVSKNAKITNLSSDSIVEIVYLEKEDKSQKITKAIEQKKSKKPLQPPIVIKDTDTIKSEGVLSFSSVPKMPSTLFYPGKTTRAALVQSGNFVVKLFPLKKANNNITYTLFLNDARPIRTAFTDVYLQHQIHLENQITRPPPCNSVRV